MSPSALADRLLAGRVHGPIVDAIVNGRGLTPPSESVNRVWLVERMVPFNAKTCRSHVFELEMGSDDPAAKPYAQPIATYPIKIAQYDRLWVPPNGEATIASCAAAPAQASGFGDGGLGLQQAAELVEQARAAFAFPMSSRLSVKCRGEHHACGRDPKKALSTIDWNALGLVEQVSPRGETYYLGDVKPEDASWGPAYVRFTFPYAAGGATWKIIVKRKPKIVAVSMLAETVVYH